MVPMVIMAPQLQMVAENFHSLTPEKKQRLSAQLLIYVLQAQVVHIIDKVAEVEAVAPVMYMTTLKLSHMVTEWAATVAVKIKLVQPA